MDRILIIETEARMMSVFSVHLASHDLKIVDSSAAAIEILEAQDFDAVIFDSILPVNDILHIIHICQRKKSCLTIIFSSESCELKKHVVFSMDVDDFIPRSDDLSELKLRLESKLRKMRHAQATPCIVQMKHIKLDVFEKVILDKKNNKLTPLSESETRLLYCLIQDQKNFIPRDKFYEVLQIRQDGSVKRPIDQHICNLRKKLEPLGFVIASRKNEGYRLLLV